MANAEGSRRIRTLRRGSCTVVWLIKWSVLYEGPEYNIHACSSHEDRPITDLATDIRPEVEEVRIR